jgi:hypothetical protein
LKPRRISADIMLTEIKQKVQSIYNKILLRVNFMITPRDRGPHVHGHDHDIQS